MTWHKGLFALSISLSDFGATTFSTTVLGQMTFSITINEKPTQQNDTQHNGIQYRLMLFCHVVYAECHQQTHYAQCLYAKCQYAECRGTLILQYKVIWAGIILLKLFRIMTLNIRIFLFLNSAKDCKIIFQRQIKQTHFWTKLFFSKSHLTPKSQYKTGRVNGP